MMQDPKITIIGAGEIGMALRDIFLEVGRNVEMWDKDETKVEGQKAIEELIPQSDVVFLCIPSRAIRPCLGELGQYLKSGVFILSLASQHHYQYKYNTQSHSITFLYI